MFIRGSHASFVRCRPRGRRAAALVRMSRSDTWSAFCVLVPAAACRFKRHGLCLSPPRDLSLGLSLGSEGSRALLLTSERGSQCGDGDESAVEESFRQTLAHHSRLQVAIASESGAPASSPQPSIAQSLCADGSLSLVRDCRHSVALRMSEFFPLQPS